jgi:hypothetical protein
MLDEARIAAMTKRNAENPNEASWKFYDPTPTTQTKVKAPHGARAWYKLKGRRGCMVREEDVEIDEWGTVIKTMKHKEFFLYPTETLARVAQKSQNYSGEAAEYQARYPAETQEQLKMFANMAKEVHESYKKEQAEKDE